MEAIPGLPETGLGSSVHLKAIVSDIHGNMEAFKAVLDDIHAQGITEILCLGDIVGYGPNPCECIDLVQEHCQVSLLGNHDQAALFDPDGFNAPAERAIFWTRKVLEGGPPLDSERRWGFLGELPRIHRDGRFMFVHGSARNPLNEYVFPDDIFQQRKMEKIFALVEYVCFQGHTHIPGVFTEDFDFLAPEEIDFTYTLTEHKALVNVGSVGQPRNNDPRSSYVVIDGNTITFRRVEYPFEITRRKIHENPELEDYLGDRLAEGR